MEDSNFILYGIIYISKNILYFIDFKPDIKILNNRAIQNREIATKKSFNNQNLDVIAEQEGSPSFEIINSLIKTLQDMKIIPKFYTLIKV